VILLSLPVPAEVEDVVLATRGLMQLAPGGLLVNLTTVSPEFVCRLAAEARVGDVDVLDAAGERLRGGARDGR